MKYQARLLEHVQRHVTSPSSDTLPPTELQLKTVFTGTAPPPSTTPIEPQGRRRIPIGWAISDVCHYYETDSQEYVVQVQIQSPPTIPITDRPQLVLQCDDENPLTWSGSTRIMQLNGPHIKMEVQARSKVTKFDEYEGWTWWVEYQDEFMPVSVPSTPPLRVPTVPHAELPPMHVVSKPSFFQDLRLSETCSQVLAPHNVSHVYTASAEYAKLRVHPTIVPKSTPAVEHIDVFPDATETLEQLHVLIQSIGQELHQSQQWGIAGSKPDTSIGELYSTQARTDAAAASLLHAL